MLYQVTLLNRLWSAFQRFPTACASPSQVQDGHENTLRCMVSDGLIDITAPKLPNGHRQPWESIALSGHFHLDRQ